MKEKVSLTEYLNKTQNNQNYTAKESLNLPPINFESNEDSLDGFDLAEFEPR